MKRFFCAKSGGLSAVLMVAAWAGIRPTTMARLLINRGARAIVDEELRYRRQLGVRV